MKKDEEGLSVIMRQDSTVGGVAAATPDALPVFRALGIDYCCGGKRPLAEALAEKGLALSDFSDMVQKRAAQAEAAARAKDFPGMSPEVLSAYIEDTHHDYLRRALPRIEQLLAKVLRAHGANHRELFEVSGLFGRLKSDLEQHLVKEEVLLFP
ncbi:MAG: DUF542 domain-containing protein, partial [Lentisphaerae bacterium]|nr:DUF542 domain-containing protein [Lentisphaerota bacterium]